LGDHVRVGVGAIVHSGTVLPDRARVGMRHIAVPSADGFISTSDIEQVRLHEQVMSALHQEIDAWHDQRK
jgi:hypothetical protein